MIKITKQRAKIILQQPPTTGAEDWVPEEDEFEMFHQHNFQDLPDGEEPAKDDDINRVLYTTSTDPIPAEPPAEVVQILLAFRQNRIL